jgi:hypothetical protein
MSDPTRPDRESPLLAHAAECDECGAQRETIAAIERLLMTVPPPALDAARLSQRVLTVAAPELARARGADWRRLAAGVLGSLFPLPLVLALNALFVALLHTVLTLIGLPTVATYAVVSYAAGLVVVLGVTYAAIPVLVERSAGPRLIPLA